MLEIANLEVTSDNVASSIAAIEPTQAQALAHRSPFRPKANSGFNFQPPDPNAAPSFDLYKLVLEACPSKHGASPETWHARHASRYASSAHVMPNGPHDMGGSGRGWLPPLVGAHGRIYVKTGIWWLQRFF